MTGLEWIIDIPTCINLERKTIYYFEPILTSEELFTFIERVNDSILHKNLSEWLHEFHKSDRLKYFAVDNHMNLDGWCDETTLEDAIEIHHPGYNPIDGRTL